MFTLNRIRAFPCILQVITCVLNKILVWKEIDYGDMTESEKQQLVREVNLLREFRHSNIVRYYDRQTKF